MGKKNNSNISYSNSSSLSPKLDLKLNREQIKKRRNQKYHLKAKVKKRIIKNLTNLFNSQSKFSKKEKIEEKKYQK